MEVFGGEGSLWVKAVSHLAGDCPQRWRPLGKWGGGAGGRFRREQARFQDGLVASLRARPTLQAQYLPDAGSFPLGRRQAASFCHECTVPSACSFSDSLGSRCRLLLLFTSLPPFLPHFLLTSVAAYYRPACSWYEYL